MAEVSVRPARPEDAAEIARIQVDTWRIAYAEVLPAARARPGSRPRPPSRHGRRRSTRRRARPTACWSRSRASGGSASRRSAPPTSSQPDDPEPGTTVAVAPLLVDPRWGRRGHGSRLLAATVDHARADGMTRAIAWIPEADNDLSRFPAVGRLGSGRAGPRAGHRRRRAARDPAAHVPHRGGDVSFAGIPLAALDFYEDLEADNSKSFWTAHKQHLRRVGAGAARRTRRPNWRRSSARRSCSARTATCASAKDKTPYKTHQGVWFAESRPATCRSPRPDCCWPGATTGRRRRRCSACAAAWPTTSPGRSSSGPWRHCGARASSIRGEQLTRVPSGYPKDHPRAELLRYKSLAAMRELRLSGLADDTEGAHRDHEGVARLGPLVSWLDTHVGRD